MSVADGTTAGILLVDKPEGPTSHDLVARVRRILGTRRIGHAGTLDPMATGLLVLCVGRATRLARFLASGGKRYEGRFRLGWGTDTLDRTGRPLEAPRPAPEDARQVAGAMERLVGRSLQVPPAFSAKRIGGVRAHVMARRGAARSPAAVEIEVHAFRLLALERGEARFEVHCSPGTYVRALARDVGVALGCGAHLTELRRTTSGEFSVEHAWPLPRLEAAGARGIAERALLPLGSVGLGMPAVRGDEAAASRLARGLPLAAGACTDPLPEEAALCRVLDPSGELLAVTEVDRGRRLLLPRVVLAAAPPDPAR